MSKTPAKNNDCHLDLDFEPEFINKQSEIAELVRGLKYMNDCDGCYFLLGRLKALANAMQDKNATPREEIEEIVYLQIQIIDQARHTLNFQDKIIRKLKGLLSDLYVDDLESLFMYDNLGYNDSVSMCDLKTWADIYGFDLEKVKDLLGNEENEKQTIESIQN